MIVTILTLLVGFALGIGSTIIGIVLIDDWQSKKGKQK